MCQSEYGSNELCVKMKTMFQGIQRLCRIKNKIVGGGGGGGAPFFMDFEDQQNPEFNPQPI